MVDRIDSARRSENMRRVRSSDTKPELLVRSVVHRLGYRFSLHRRDLPGTPDLVLPRLKTVMFVHGCFWHRHLDCVRTTTPATRTAFWKRKFCENEQRDRRILAELRSKGWNVCVVWECEIKDRQRLRRRLDRLLGSRLLSLSKTATPSNRRNRSFPAKRFNLAKR